MHRRETCQCKCRPMCAPPSVAACCWTRVSYKECRLGNHKGDVILNRGETVCEAFGWESVACASGVAVVVSAGKL